MAEEEKKVEVKAVVHHPADTNGDGKVSAAEEAMYLEFKRKELEDADAMRDAQRKMTWFALAGLLLYPLAVVLLLWLDYQKHRKHLVQWHQPTL